MQKFRRILAALDLSDNDQRILQFLANNASLLGIEKAYFVHIMPDFSVPKNVKAEFQKLFAPEYPIDEKIRDKLGFDIEEAFNGEPGFDYSIEVIEGKPYEKLLHWGNVKEAGLLVVGKKRSSEGSGITAKRVARNARQHILFIPNTATTEVSQLIVPMDFSKNSLHALQTALKFKEKNGELSIQGLYVVDLPPEDYYSRSKPGRGYRGVLMESAQNAYEAFVKQHDIPSEAINMTFLENNRHDVSAHIEAFAAQQGKPLIIIGAKGHSPFETFLFGSVTEKLAERFYESPLLIVR